MVGLCCAYALRAKGASIAIVEAGDIAAGASQGNIGWITPTLTEPLGAPGVIRETLRAAIAFRGPLGVTPAFNPAVLQWLWRFRAHAGQSRFREGLRALRALSDEAESELNGYRARGVSFEFHDGGLLVASIRASGLDWLLRLGDELARVGYPRDLQTLTGDVAREREPALGPAIIQAAYAAADRRVRPESLCQGLAAYLRNSGVDLFTGRPAQRLRPGDDHVVVDTNDGPVVARSAVLATGVDTNRLLRPLGHRLPIIGAKGYSITIGYPGVRPRSALYLSEAKVGLSPYHDAVRIGGFFELGARSTVTVPDRVEHLMAAPKAYLRDWRVVEDLAGVHAWAGLRPSTPDSLPFIGAVPGVRNLFIAAGHGMLGMTLAPTTGALLARLIVDGKPPGALRPFAVLR